MTYRVTWIPDDPNQEKIVRVYPTLKEMKNLVRFNKPLKKFPHKERYQDRYAPHVAGDHDYSWSGQKIVEKID
jgi:hypothetical protein